MFICEKLLTFALRPSPLDLRPLTFALRPFRPSPLAHFRKYYKIFGFDSKKNIIFLDCRYIAERMKILAYQSNFAQSWFWRTQQQKEIDYLEEEDGVLKAFEFKLNGQKANTKCPAAFANAYPSASFQVITPHNIEDFLYSPLSSADSHT